MNKVSIIVPIYNVEKYVKRCLESLINQTYTDIEIITVIDGSEDNSEQIISEMAKKDVRIKIIKKENGGLSSARNEGIKHITGEFLMYVDADDWIDHDCIEKCMSKFDKDIDVVVFPYIKEYPSNSAKTSFFGKNIMLKDDEVTRLIYRRFFGLYRNELSNPEKIDELSSSWGKIYKTEIIEDIKFVDTKIIGTEDAWYNINVFKKVHNVQYIDDVYYHYFKGNEISLTRNYKPELFNGWCNLYTYMLNYAKKEKLSEDFFEAINNRIVVNLIFLALNVVNSNMTFINKKIEIKKMLRQNIYKEAFKTFQFKYLGLKWKVFYKACQYKFAILVLLMTIFAEKIKKYRK